MQAEGRCLVEKGMENCVTSCLVAATSLTCVRSMSRVTVPSEEERQIPISRVTVKVVKVSVFGLPVRRRRRGQRVLVPRFGQQMPSA